MKLAKHIQIARENGAAAGLEFYLGVPASKLHPQYAEITKKRTDKTRLAAYCSIFGIDNAPVEKATESPEDFSAIVQAVLAAMGTNVEDDEPTVPATVVSRGKAKAKSGRTKPAINVITREDAWLAAGGDPQFKPRTNGDQPANNGQLYRLNMLGKLVLSD